MLRSNRSFVEERRGFVLYRQTSTGITVHWFLLSMFIFFQYIMLYLVSLRHNRYISGFPQIENFLQT
jgi:hypothetical protein